MSQERDSILGRIREALSVRAPRFSHHSEPTPAGENSRPVQDWLPRVGERFEDRLALFQKNATDLKADFIPIPNEASLPAVLTELKAKDGWRRVASHKTPLADEVTRLLGLPVLHVDDGYRPEDLEECDVGITACEALVAQTGSVLVTSRSAGGRALSVLPPHHLVIATREQLVADLTEAFGLLKVRYGSDFPSFISFITGPSRTGDIERILVLGAHGPKKLTILCL
jgi:L-lactate dehydrogenase complex protein LldG